MPIKDFIERYSFDPTTFNYDEFKEAALKEYESDVTAWQAGIRVRDEKITATEGALTKAQSAAWDLMQKQQVEQPKELAGQKPKPEDDETNVTWDDMFTTVEKE